MHLQELILQPISIGNCDTSWTGDNSFCQKIWISYHRYQCHMHIWCVTAYDISVYMESRFFDGMKYLLFMFEMYYWGRLRKEGSNYKDKYNHSWTLVCQHTYPSQEVPSAGLLLYRAKHECKRCQSSMTILLCFSITESCFLNCCFVGVLTKLWIHVWQSVTERPSETRILPLDWWHPSLPPAPLSGDRIVSRCIVPSVAPKCVASHPSV